MSGLRKLKNVDINDSNIAQLGSDLEKKVRLEAAQTEKAWADLGKKVGLKIWRIEKFKVVEWPAEEYGKFYSGDAYIILNTYKKDDDPKFYYDIHFWLGVDCTQDEAGTAAYKTVEADDYLHGDAVQHREVQEYESPLFLSYFKELIFMDGGIATGFKHVEPEKYTPRLLWVRDAGQNNLQVRQVPLSHKSLNSGDVFIYDGGLQLYQWNGTKSAPTERTKAIELVNNIQNERNGKCKIERFSEGDKDAAPFWNAIGGEGPVRAHDDGDIEFKKASQLPKVLLKVSDATGSLVMTEIARGSFKKSLITEDDAFILDIGSSVYVYIGKKASKNERKMGLNFAMEYLKKNNRPMTTHISRVLAGADCPEFEAAFEGAPKPMHVGGKPLGSDGKVKSWAPVAAPNLKR